MKIDYPKNLTEYFRPLEHPDFTMWAFGMKRPRSCKVAVLMWEKLHPNIPMDDDDVMYICICKMVYIYENYVLKQQQQRSKL